jgi:hypothetical protein
MATNQRRYVEHKHGNTNHTIWLPPSSRLGRYPDQPEMGDNTYSENYVCPACGLVSAYRSRVVQWRPLGVGNPGPPAGLYAAVLVSRCDEENCEIHVLIRKSTVDTKATDTLVQEAESWTLVDVRCPRGHLVTRVSSNAVALTDQQLGLLG